MVGIKHLFYNIQYVYNIIHYDTVSVAVLVVAFNIYLLSNVSSFLQEQPSRVRRLCVRADFGRSAVCVLTLSSQHWICFSVVRTVHGRCAVS